MRSSEAKKVELLRNKRDHIAADAMAKVRKIAAQLRDENTPVLRSARALEECVALFENANSAYNSALLSVIRPPDGSSNEPPSRTH